MRRSRRSGRGWTRTSSLLFVRQALSAIELLARKQFRDKGSNLDLHVQSVASCRLDDPGMTRCPPSTPCIGGRRSGTARRALARRTTDSERCCPCHSPTLRPWIAGRSLRNAAGDRPTWRSFGARRSCRYRKSQAKAAAYSAANFPAPQRRGTFLSQAGPRVRSVFSQAEHHLFGRVGFSSRNDEGDPLGSPSLELGMRPKR